MPGRLMAREFRAACGFWRRGLLGLGEFLEEVFGSVRRVRKATKSKRTSQISGRESSRFMEVVAPRVITG